MFEVRNPGCEGPFGSVFGVVFELFGGAESIGGNYTFS